MDFNMGKMEREAEEFAAAVKELLKAIDEENPAVRILEWAETQKRAGSRYDTETKELFCVICFEHEEGDLRLLGSGRGYYRGDARKAALREMLK